MSNKCPRCFTPTDPMVAYWQCTGSCATVKDERAMAYTGGNAQITGPEELMVSRGRFFEQQQGPRKQRGQVFVPPPPVDRCPRCEGGARQVCEECHFPMPRGWTQARSVVVAMAGARASGKSLYVAIAVKQLQQLAARNGAVLEPADLETARTFDEKYLKPLYEQMKGMPPTPSEEAEDSYQRNPLMWRWVDPQHGTLFNLSLRDVAGEDLESGATGLRFAFFGKADAVFFMFDPMRIDAIRQKLHGLIPEQSNVGGDPLKVLSAVKTNIGGGRPRFAVILSKFDTLQCLKDVDDHQWREVMQNPGAAFNREADPFVQMYDEADGRLLHEEVRSLMIKLGGAQVLNAVGHGDYRLFAVSTLGEATRGEALSKHGISPFRCLDPMRWAVENTLSAASAQNR